MDLTTKVVGIVESGGKLHQQGTMEDAAPAVSDVAHTHGQGEEALKDIVCGSLAGIVGKYIEYPFDTVKVRLQSQPDHLPLIYRGPLDCFKKSLQRDGFLGIYRGISAPLVGAAVETGCLFFSYRVAQDALKTLAYPEHRADPSKELPYTALLSCGAVSGAFTSLFLTPIELVKCKMQVPASSPTIHRPNISGIIASIYRHQGLMGYWHGQMGTLIRETGGSAAWFGGYEGVKLLFRRANPQSITDAEVPVYQRLASGAVAGMAYNFLFYPADTIKSRMQTEDVKGITGGKSTFGAQALEKIVLDPKYHDILALVKGIRNGIVYGTKVRFPHALVMIFLFRSGSFRTKCLLVYRATRQHARNLALFALVYKSSMLLLKNISPTGKERHYDAFVAGLLGGYTVFARTINNSVSQQIVIYVFARVVLAIAKLAVQSRDVGGGQKGIGEPGGGGGWEVLGRGEWRKEVARNGWPVFASLSWAMVMYVFRWHPESLQTSLRSSMQYIYVQSDDWDSLRTFIWHNK
ncbi:mitochondrial carrier domain-containing protein [Lophiotrema nucula]|uniref:Mitochondrial carrier domain-containing protein n=1 Tax=Lophiotrema nucula TaxID=690887 RepID=A0A6A5ZJ40_9PLEO|nr:mitochondrial carrier domain-containing protein [Lophiotrema nucula]